MTPGILIPAMPIRIWDLINIIEYVRLPCFFSRDMTNIAPTMGVELARPKMILIRIAIRLLDPYFLPICRPRYTDIMLELGV